MRALSRRTLRERHALERLVDAATEFVCVHDPKVATLVGDLAWHDLCRANDEWQEAQLASAKKPRPSLKKKSARASRRSVKASKKGARAAETAAIRGSVVQRANGMCEGGCGREGAHMDHFFGRGKARQSVANCWLLCVDCDRQKTNNHPNPDQWLLLFLEHCDRNGYDDAAFMANRRLEFVRARAALSSTRLQGAANNE